MKPTPGLCDRCGLRFHLKDLREEYLIGRKTGKRVCRWCYDESHPQLDTRNVRTDDKQSVGDARSDALELAESRRLWGFYPCVGHQTTSTLEVQLGRVRVTT
jgi:hypothetical protein